MSSSTDLATVTLVNSFRNEVVLKMNLKHPPSVSSSGNDDGKMTSFSLPDLLTLPLFCRMSTLPSAGWKRSVSGFILLLSAGFWSPPVQPLLSVPSGGPPHAASKIIAPAFSPLVSRSMHTDAPYFVVAAEMPSVKHNDVGALPTARFS